MKGIWIISSHIYSFRIPVHLIEASPCLLSNYTNYCSGCQKDIASHLNADKSVIHRAQPGAAESLGAALWAKDLSLLSFSEAMAAEGQISKQSLPIVLKGRFLGLQPKGDAVILPVYWHKPGTSTDTYPTTSDFSSQSPQVGSKTAQFQGKKLH